MEKRKQHRLEECKVLRCTNNRCNIFEPEQKRLYGDSSMDGTFIRKSRRQSLCNCLPIPEMWVMDPTTMKASHYPYNYDNLSAFWDRAISSIALTEMEACDFTTCAKSGIFRSGDMPDIRKQWFRSACQTCCDSAAVVGLKHDGG